MREHPHGAARSPCSSLRGAPCSPLRGAHLRGPVGLCEDLQSTLRRHARGEPAYLRADHACQRPGVAVGATLISRSHQISVARRGVVTEGQHDDKTGGRARRGGAGGGRPRRALSRGTEHGTRHAPHKPAQDGKGRDWTGQDRAGQVGTGRNRSGYGSTGLDGTG
eukprot:gene14277-biopygen7009